MGFVQVFRFPPTAEKYASRWISYTKLPLGVKENVHGALQWTGSPSVVYSCLMDSVHRISPRAIATLSRKVSKLFSAVAIQVEVLQRMNTMGLSRQGPQGDLRLQHKAGITFPHAWWRSSGQYTVDYMCWMTLNCLLQGYSKDSLDSSL